MDGPDTPAKKALVSTIPYFRSWIAVNVDGNYVLAPSKWVGYVDMEPDYSLDTITIASMVVILSGSWRPGCRRSMSTTRFGTSFMGSAPNTERSPTGLAASPSCRLRHRTGKNRLLRTQSTWPISSLP